MKKIVIVTSGQPSANPRMVKEAIALAEFGHNVSVIYCPISTWANEYDNILFEENKNIKWIKVGFQKKDNNFKYLVCRIRQKFWHICFKFFGNIFDAAIKSMVLFSNELKKEACKQNGEIFIGHNLGALPAVILAAKKYNAKAFFDFEDFHRGEHNEGSIEWNKSVAVESKYIPYLKVAIAASPLIAEQYQNLFPSISFVTINNCFPLKYAAPRLVDLSQMPLKLFWFSQTIGKGRGLENVIEAMGKLPNLNIELTLLGNITHAMKVYFNEIVSRNNLALSKLTFLNPVNESEIVSIASNHHIGLATEVPSTLNRDYCLTNKIFMYLLAGNAIIFSDTKAQRKFLKNNSNIGVIISLDEIETIKNALNDFATSESLLMDCRVKALELGKLKYNWSIEKEQLLKFKL